MDRPDIEELRVHEKYNHTFGPLAQEELGKALDYIEYLEVELEAAKADSYSEMVKRLNKFERECGL